MKEVKCECGEIASNINWIKTNPGVFYCDDCYSTELDILDGKFDDDLDDDNNADKA